MTRVYYKEAVGAFVVFDVTRISTFDAVKKWKSDIDAKVSNLLECRKLSYSPLFNQFVLVKLFF